MKIWDKNCKRFINYYKIYKIDGKIDTDIFTIMVTSYFVGNEDVKDYFKKLSK